MSIQVSIADEQSAIKVERARLREVMVKTLRSEGVAEASISLALVDDATIHDLNRRHLQHDYPTDVLSFLLSGSAGGDDRKPPESLEGEVVVSTETAVRQAAAYGWAPEAELTLYLVHGLLHLCGYDDHSAAERRRMRRRERSVLQIWGLTPHY